MTTSPSAAIEQGIGYLLTQAEAGHWRGFPTLAGESDVWVTAFILAHISPFLRRRRILRGAIEFLIHSQLPNGGWSYGAGVPADADSTAWALIALKGTKRLKADNRRAAFNFLHNHSSARGVATYCPDSGIREYTGADPAHSFDGWFDSHPDVTAAAVLAGNVWADDALAQHTLSDLISRQTGAGFWNAYWWRGPHYTTTILLRALTEQKYYLPQPQAELLLRALQREQLADGGFAMGADSHLDPFTTALAVESLAHLSYLGGDDLRNATGSALLMAQESEGNWPGNYVLRIPAPDVTEPRHVGEWSRQGQGGNSYIFDRGGLFATAIACRALATCQQVESEAGSAKRRSWPVWEVGLDRDDDQVIDIPVRQI